MSGGRHWHVPQMKMDEVLRMRSLIHNGGRCERIFEGVHPFLKRSLNFPISRRVARSFFPLGISFRASLAWTIVKTTACPRHAPTATTRQERQCHGWALQI